MNTKELLALGVPRGPIMQLAQRALATAAQQGIDKRSIRGTMHALLDDPAPYLNDAVFGLLATAWRNYAAGVNNYVPRKTPAPFQTWGEGLDDQSLQQMRNACALPISVRGALMPDAPSATACPSAGCLPLAGRSFRMPSAWISPAA